MKQSIGFLMVLATLGIESGVYAQVSPLPPSADTASMRGAEKSRFVPREEFRTWFSRTSLERRSQIDALLDALQSDNAQVDVPLFYQDISDPRMLDLVTSSFLQIPKARKVMRDLPRDKLVDRIRLLLAYPTPNFMDEDKIGLAGNLSALALFANIPKDEHLETELALSIDEIRMMGERIRVGSEAFTRRKNSYGVWADGLNTQFGFPMVGLALFTQDRSDIYRDWLQAQYYARDTRGLPVAKEPLPFLRGLGNGKIGSFLLINAAMRPGKRSEPLVLQKLLMALASNNYGRDALSRVPKTTSIVWVKKMAQDKKEIPGIGLVYVTLLLNSGVNGSRDLDKYFSPKEALAIDSSIKETGHVDDESQSLALAIFNAKVSKEAKEKLWKKIRKLSDPKTDRVSIDAFKDVPEVTVIFDELRKTPIGKRILLQEKLRVREMILHLPSERPEEMQARRRVLDVIDLEEIVPKSNIEHGHRH